MSQTAIETHTVKHLDAYPSLGTIQVRYKGSAFLLHNNFRQGPISFGFVASVGYDDILPQSPIIFGHDSYGEWEG